MKTKTSITLSRENLREILSEAVSTLVPGFTLEKFLVHQNGSIDVTLTPASQPALPLDAMPVRLDVVETGPAVNPLLDGRPS